jgi:hypothetical protein
MKAPQRRQIADRFAVMAVDLVEASPWHQAFPEELLELQHRLEEQFYVELAQAKP